MKTNLLTLSSIIFLSLFTGCGSNVTTSDKIIKPHDTSKLGRVVSLQKDWSWFVDSTIKNYTGGFNVEVNFYQGFPSSVKHYQYFLDTDNDKSSGFNGKNGWEITGADYLIEDGVIFKYISNAENKWNWEEVISFPDKLLQQNGSSGKISLKGLFNLEENILNNNQHINTMMEVYDKDWAGDYPTVTNILTTITDSDINTIPIKKYTYKRILDIKGNIIEEERLDNNKWLTIHTYKYNTKGQKTESFSNLSHTKLIYTYNNNGDLESKTFTHSFIKGVETYSYVYDEQGRKTTMTKYYKEYRKNYENNKYELKKEQTEIYLHTYIQGTNLISKITLNGKFYQSFTYNEDDTIDTRTTRIKYSINSHNINYLNETYTYDNEGRVIKVESQNDDGTLTKRVKNYIYELNN